MKRFVTWVITSRCSTRYASGEVVGDRARQGWFPLGRPLDERTSRGVPSFLNRYGISLENLVRQACETEDVEAEDGHTDEALGYLSASLTEASGADSAAGRAVGAVTRARNVNGTVQLGQARQKQIDGGELPELSVMPRVAWG